MSDEHVYAGHRAHMVEPIARRRAKRPSLLCAALVSTLSKARVSSTLRSMSMSRLRKSTVGFQGPAGDCRISSLTISLSSLALSKNRLLRVSNTIGTKDKN